MRPNFLMGLAVLLTAALVGYMWDIETCCIPEARTMQTEQLLASSG